MHREVEGSFLEIKLCSTALFQLSGPRRYLQTHQLSELSCFVHLFPSPLKQSASSAGHILCLELSILKYSGKHEKHCVP